MKTLWAALIFSASLCGQDLSFYIDNSGSLSALPSTYSFQSTVAGNSSNVNLRVVNSSPNPIEIVSMIVSTTSGSNVVNGNFSIPGFPTALVLPPQGFQDFTVNFTPLAAGQVSGFLVADYVEEQNGCTIPSPGTDPCLSVTTPSQLQGTATAQLVLSYNGTQVQPNTAAAIQFGSIAIGSSQSIIFTLTNQSTDTINVPTVAVQAPGVFAASQFSITSGLPLPETLAGSATANFTVTFAPQANGPGPYIPETATLLVGTDQYPLQGSALPPPGTPPNSAGLLPICTDKTGAHVQGTAIAMGPDPNTMTLTFTVENPNPPGTAYATLTAQPALSSSSSSAFAMGAITLAPYASGVTGASSTISAAQPITIQPGWAITFQVTFSPTQAASASGTLTIATGITYSLAGKAPAPLDLTLECGSTACSGQSFTSQEQVQASLDWANSSTADVPPDVTLALTFESAGNGITSDPAIYFMPNQGTENIGPISFSPNSAAGVFTSGASKGQSQFTFQTGTTAGKITLTATGLENVTQSWTIGIPASKVEITSISAQAQASNVVVTVDGYDNTYSAGALSFTFYNTAGQAIAPGAISVDATSNFHQYFFNGNQAGGAFALQATFPVNGDVTQIASVAVTISNSVGSTSATSSF